MSKQQPRVIVVSNRLPVHIKKEAGALQLQRTIGGLATALGSIMETYPMLWIGWAGNERKLTKQQRLKLQFPDKLVEIAISSRELNRYYNVVANSVLWPIMHGIMPTKISRESDWKTTKTVVAKFVSAVEENLRPGDVIWVHDYHLAMLPKLLREHGIKNRIGFFLHTPFPPYTKLSRWDHTKDIVDSLSRVDVLGFQADRDVRHFRAALHATKTRMKNGAVVKVFPIGVDYHSFRAAHKLKSVGKQLKQIRSKITGKKVILSVSRLDYTKGIIEQLRAVESVLNDYPSGKIVYKLIVAPSREVVDDYRKLRDDIHGTVKEINARFKQEHGYEPVDFDYRSYGFEELNAWYRLTDVLLVTPVMDGMNLVVKEYIAARENSRGVVVISKTIGAAYQLKDAIQVNPRHIGDIAKGLNQALNMPHIEKRRRWKALQLNVREQNIFWWTRTFIETLTQRKPS